MVEGGARPGLGRPGAPKVPTAASGGSSGPMGRPPPPPSAGTRSRGNSDAGGGGGISAPPQLAGIFAGVGMPKLKSTKGGINTGGK